MIIKKAVPVLLTLLLMIPTLAGCSKEESSKSQKGVTTIEFWTAPNPPQQAYWKQMAQEFEKEHPEIRIKVSPIKETPSSEAYIISALIAGDGPTISENISRGFAAQLAESHVLEPLDQRKDLKAVQSRNMTKTMAGWTFPDKHQYVLPVYSNPMLFGWRIDILTKLGISRPPKTYSEVLDTARKLKEKYPNKFLWAKADLADPTGWKRWFDFFMLYDAASNGNLFVRGNRFVADEKAAKQVFQFVLDLSHENALLTKQAENPFETGMSIFSDLGPWTFNYWAEKFPNMKMNKTFTLAYPPVPDGMDLKHPKTFADSKGIVLFAQKPEAEKKAAVQFLNWVYANPEHDLTWFKTTNLPPARDDLSSNPVFRSFLDKNPALLPYAEAIPDGVPVMANSKYNQIQTYIGTKAFNQVVKGEKSPDQAWNDMKIAIQKELGE
ncbi:MAG: ABC transporter substrate-binding protein [Thermoactinomyces sp.]